MKIMPLESLNSSDNRIIDNDSPVVSEVELGIAKLNRVSHHEYLRCAKYVNPLVRQLSAPGTPSAIESPAIYNRNSLIILDPEIVESDTEQDVYESELESSLENALELDGMDESDTTLSDKDDRNDSDKDDNLSGSMSSIKGEIEDGKSRSYETSKENDVKTKETETYSDEKYEEINRNEAIVKYIEDTKEERLRSEVQLPEIEDKLILKTANGKEVVFNTVKAEEREEKLSSELELLKTEDIESDILQASLQGNTESVSSDRNMTLYVKESSCDKPFAHMCGTDAQNLTDKTDITKTVTVSADSDSETVNSVAQMKTSSGNLEEVTTYKSTSFLILSPSSERSVVESFGRLREEEDAVAVEQKTATTDETRNSVPEENALKVNGTSDISENGISEEDAVRDPNIFRETHEKEEVHFAEMNSVREKFESGGKSDEDQAPRRVSVKDEYDQGGEFENEPVQNPDVVKETDRPKEELPEVGSAKSLVNRFKSIQEEKAQPVASSKRPSPPRDSEKVEYESQPTEHLPQYEGQTESGVFESEPKGHEDVVRSGDLAEDYKPEEGSAKNILNKFKEIQTESSQHKVHEKREITPDRSGKVEYVSEPRGEHIVYNETQTESGVFENVPKEEEDVVRSGEKADEILPEVGMAKSLLSKFKQMETEVGHRPPPSPNKEKPKKAEFVNSPRGYLEKYEPQVEAGEFENKPADRGEVVRSEDHTEDILPEVGSAKKTMERFREIQKQSSSPVSSKAKEITPPREQSPGRNVAGVFENTPAERDDLVRSGEVQPDELPEQGTTRNILNRFKEIQTSGSQSSSPGKKPKEFTPPPEAGVYENNPQEHLIIETRQAESGILESTPSKSQADVAREREATPESELPEQGFAKNLVSRWKQLESTSSSAKSTSSTSPRFKEFTPPRDSRGPLSPKSPAGVTNGVHPSDLPGQYQPQESTVIHENKPEVKEDVYREADTDWTDGMPAPNTTSSMLQRFKSIQEEAKINEKTPEPIHRKDDSQPPQPDTEEKGMFKVVQTEKCAACQKTVYAMEKLEMNGHIYHKNCFKCSHCSARLTAKTFSMNEGVIYCVNHFKQLFARKGNYDEGFGRQQYKKKWQGDKPEGATA
ncbi:uncharacterized protein LOC123536284 isoform X9 [Mercenaria mercenaria]|uniref:uncharacterized protein LOC123536284 isoform X9 n=1 Tax=Mercenaria mercenaria TaxID=6596 RepID=UPI00234EC819|nr:uncharacterized protein LOC123536284 isoform X9 [Mercenaria mercenaria]